MGRKRFAGLLVIAASVAAALLAASPAFAWQVSLTAQPKLKRTHSWKIEKSVSQSAITLKAGETADVTYSVTATPLGFVDSDWRVDGTAHLSRDPNIDVNGVEVNIQLQDIVFDRNPIPAAVTCDSPFPVDLAVNEVNCQYGVALPDSTPRNVVMRATLVGGGRVATQEFDFTNATVEHVDESVSVVDSMTGALGTVDAADGPKTFTYTKRIGPFTTAQCGQQTVNNTATSTTVDSGTTASASAAVVVTVTCPPPPPPKDPCKDKDRDHNWYGKGKGHDNHCDDDHDRCDDRGKGKGRDDDRGKGKGWHDDRDRCDDDHGKDRDHDRDRCDDDRGKGKGNDKDRDDDRGKGRDDRHGKR